MIILEVVTLPGMGSQHLQRSKGNKEEDVGVNFLPERKTQEELLVEASGKIAHRRKYCLGESWFCIFPFLNRLGLKKRNKVENSI